MTQYTPLDFSSLLGTKGLSDTLLLNHFALYEGDVKNVNLLTELLPSKVIGSPEHAELRRRFGWEWNGMRLHELYFGNLTQSTATPPTGIILEKILESFGSLEAWQQEFFGIAAMRGIGWAILALDPLSGRLFNLWINEHDGGLLAGSVPLLVLDVFEHAYITDYGIKRAEYLTLCAEHLDWERATSRLIDIR